MRNCRCDTDVHCLCKRRVGSLKTDIVVSAVDINFANVNGNAPA